MRKHKIAKWRIAPALVAAGLLLGGCGEQTAGSAQQAASAPQQVAAQGKKKIVVGVDFNYPPMAFQTASGEKKGFDIDLMREAFKRMGVEFEAQDINWNAFDTLLGTAKTVDMMWSGTTVTEQRKKLYAFTDPYLHSKVVIAVPANSPIASKRDLLGKKVGISTNSTALGKVEEMLGSSGGEAVQYMNTAAAMSAALAGNAQAAVGNDLEIFYYEARNPGKFRILADDFGEMAVAVALRQEDAALLADLNKALDSMRKDGTEKAIRQRWFGEHFQ